MPSTNMFKRTWITTTYGRTYNNVLSEIKNIYNQRYLKKIASKAVIWEFRQVAVSKIDDQLFLYKVAEKDKDYHVRCSAICRLQDPNIVKNLISSETSEDRDIHNRIYAATYYSSSASSQLVFEQALESYISSNSELLDDEALECASSCFNKALSEKAMAVLSSDDHADPNSRKLALRQVSEDSLLIQISENSSGEVAFMATTMISDKQKRQEELIKFASQYKNKNNQKYRLEAAKRIDDELKRKEIIKQISEDIKNQVTQISGSNSWTDMELKSIYEGCQNLL